MPFVSILTNTYILFVDESMAKRSIGNRAKQSRRTSLFWATNAFTNAREWIAFSQNKDQCFKVNILSQILFI